MAFLLQMLLIFIGWCGVLM